MAEAASTQPPVEGDLSCLELDPLLLRALIQAVKSGMQMTGSPVAPVGASRLNNAHHTVTVMLGLVGAHTGNLGLNLSEEATLHLAGGLLGEPQRDLNEDVVDAVMEVGNMVAGALKAPLSGTIYSVGNISLPSLILGKSYAMVYTRGIKSVSVEFELGDMPFASMRARYFSANVSLLRSAGSHILKP
ncbi:MAG: chemotaxis protein CheX [Myxococcota bacterium]